MLSAGINMVCVNKLTRKQLWVLCLVLKGRTVPQYLEWAGALGGAGAGGVGTAARSAGGVSRVARHSCRANAAHGAAGGCTAIAHR